MKYRVFDTSINKLFGVYQTEEEAMTLVRTLIGANEDDYADDLAVACEREDGSFSEPLSGVALVARAEQVAKEREQAQSRRDDDRPRFFRSRSGSSSSTDYEMPLAASGSRSGETGPVARLRRWSSGRRP